MPSKNIYCKVVKHSNKKISLWSSEEKDNTLLPDIIKSNKYNTSKEVLKVEWPKITNTYVNIPLTIDKKDTWIFYWASDNINEPNKIMNGDNYGLIKTNNDGECRLKLNCPNNYKHKKITFPRYVNYTYLTKEKIWNPNINILTILCYIKYKKFSKIVENKDTIILYSNDNKDDKKLIHNSYSISNKSLSEIDNKEDFMHKYIEKHMKYYDKIKENNKNIHIVVYGDNKKDESVDMLINTLLDMKYSNTIKYLGGLDEWDGMLKIKEEKENNEDILDEETMMIDYEGIPYKMFIDTSEIINDDNEIIGKLDKVKNKIIWQGDYEKLHLDNPKRIAGKDENLENYKIKLKVIKGDDEGEFINETDVDKDLILSSEEEEEEEEEEEDDEEEEEDEEEEDEEDEEKEEEEESVKEVVEEKVVIQPKEEKEEIVKKENKPLLSELILKKEKSKGKKRTEKKKRKKKTYEGFTFF